MLEARKSVTKSFAYLGNVVRDSGLSDQEVRISKHSGRVFGNARASYCCFFSACWGNLDFILYLGVLKLLVLGTDHTVQCAGPCV